MFNVEEIRRQFPALHEEFGGRPAIFFDNPGGTQVHESVSCGDGRLHDAGQFKHARAF